MEHMRQDITEGFVDYYEILQLSPNADQDTIERVYRLLAKKYHPDSVNGGDLEKFISITEAFKILSNPINRADYDATYDRDRTERMVFLYGQSDFDENHDDRKIQQGVLSLLLSARRRDAMHPGVGVYELEKFLRTPEKHLEFHVWYLKEKGWIVRTDNGQWSITAAGVDEAMKNGNFNGEKKHLLTSGQEHEHEEKKT